MPSLDISKIGCTLTVDGVETSLDGSDGRRLLEVAGEGTEEELNGIVCEYDQLDLACDLGHVISVTGATWGRDDDFQCGLGRNHCPMSDVSSLLRHQCSGKQICNDVVSGEWLRADFCPGTQKYLRYSYECMAMISLRPIESVYA